MNKEEVMEDPKQKGEIKVKEKQLMILEVYGKQDSR